MVFPSTADKVGRRYNATTDRATRTTIAWTSATSTALLMLVVWTFQHQRHPTVQVRWTATENLPERLEMFRQAATGRSAHDIYARATFVKYKALVEDFAVIARNYADWQFRRKQGVECFALLEATAASDTETAGTLLLRSTWTKEAVVDLLGTNQRTTTPVPGVGVMLVMTACSIARQSGAPRLFVETARHSTRYWRRFLKNGTPFMRYDRSDVAFARAEAILTAGEVTYATSNDQ